MNHDINKKHQQIGVNMNTFCDTNVIIGYIYSLDPLNEASKKALIKENINFYSCHVKKEVKDVARRKNREYHVFLQNISDLINDVNDNRFINLSKIHSGINKFQKIGKLDVKDMHLAIDTLWDELGFDENTEAFKVKTKFNDYCFNFHNAHRECKINCFNSMNYIPAYKEKDSVVLDKIEEKSLRDNCLHDKDEKILFDVHDYLKDNPNLDLLFISGDKKFVTAISMLMDVLAFNRFIYLKDFLEHA